MGTSVKKTEGFKEWNEMVKAEVADPTLRCNVDGALPERVQAIFKYSMLSTDGGDMCSAGDARARSRLVHWHGRRLVSRLVNWWERMLLDLL